MTSEEKELLIAYAVGRLTHEDYVAGSGADPARYPEFFERELRAAAAERDGVVLEGLLAFGFKLKLFSTHLAPLLAALLLESWHMKHEELAQILQDLREPTVVDALAAAATTKPEYLSVVDGAHAFARKCIWALADIGTSEAQQHLLRLAQTPDRELAGYAQRRLDRWEDEAERKGPRSSEPA